MISKLTQPFKNLFAKTYTEPWLDYLQAPAPRCQLKHVSPGFIYMNITLMWLMIFLGSLQLEVFANKQTATLKAVQAQSEVIIQASELLISLAKLQGVQHEATQ